MSCSERLRRPRAWVFAGTLLVMQVALVTPPVTEVAEAAGRKKPKKKKAAKAADAAPPAETGNDDILSITSGALGENANADGAAPIEDPEAGLEVGPASGPSQAATPVPRGGPAPDAQVALVKPRTRRVAVPPYVGRSADSLRQAVLEVLTEHPDLEVLGNADLSMVEKRINLSSREPESWPRIATELSLYALVVGDGDASRVRVIDPQGRTVGTLALDPKERLDVQARARLWNELGRYLSDEGLRQHYVNVMRASAAAVLRGQGEELYRQRELADRRAKLREERLLASTQRASSRLAAQDAELARQASLAQERIRQQQLAAAKAAEEARQQALAAQRQQELAARQQQAAFAAQQPQQAPLPAAYGAPTHVYAPPPPAQPSPYPAQSGYGYAPQGGYPAQPYPPQGGYPAQAPPPQGAAPPGYPPAAAGYSNRGGYVPKSQAPPAAEAAPPPQQAPPAQ